MLRIELTIALICTLGLLIAGLQGVFAGSEYLRIAQFATIGFVLFSVFAYVRLLSLKAKQS